MGFAHLHVHTEYSLLDGLSKVEELVQRAKELGQTALGMTDHGGMYGAVEFYSACKNAGIKPVIGCEFYVAAATRFDKRAADRSPFHLTVLAQNNTGYKNLLKLVTKANLEGFYYKPRVDKELLRQHADGLIVFSGCPSAELSQMLIDGDMQRAEELARWYRDTFPAFYLEVQRHENLDFLEPLNNGLLRLAEKMDLPLVATNDLHYAKPGDSPLHEVLLCIGTNTTINDPNRFKFSDESFYLKTEEEMRALFEDLPEAIAATQEIADSTDVTLDFSTLHLPQYKVPTGEDADAYLRKLCWQGFGERYPNGASDAYKQRLDYELDVISKTQYPNYFLVVWDISDFARKNDIVFGVRGSAASSLALYCLGVTDIDPLEYRLVFERFLNIERKEMPDIDMDFQDDRREEAIRYVVQQYGEEHVAQICTFGTLGAKAAIRDSGRALGMPLADVDRIARLVPTRVGMTLRAAFDASEEMQDAYTNDATLRKLIDTAFGLEGVTRHVSTHAAGVVISEAPLADHVPLQRPTRDNEHGIAMTQYAMEPVAKLGLLKMDFLGLINYSIISNTLKLIHDLHGLELRLKEITFDDPKTYDLLASGETTAIFQLESPGMRRYIKELRPNSLAELAAMVALYRPGPMEHISRYIDSKFGRVPIEYPHPDLEEILEETYGIIVYQDQVLHVLRRFAGYSLGEADIVRKAMGKKIASLMQQEREKFLTGALKLGYDEAIAGQVFDLIEPFAGYAFNKAHSVSYAVVAYWTAYFRANYPVEYMTCVLNAYDGNAEKASAVIAECDRLGIHVLPPDVSRSEVVFGIDEGPDGKPAIRYGLASIKNVGESTVADLVQERHKNGAFTSLEDFARRAGVNIANRRVLESLVRVGALDAFGHRGQLLAALDSILRLIQSEAQLKDSGQSTMFDMFGQSVPVPLAAVDLPAIDPPSAREMAAWERELMGISLSETDLSALFRNAPAEAILSKQDLEEEPEGARVLLVGQVASVRFASNKQQQRMAFVVLTLQNGSIDIGVNGRAYPTTAELWQEGNFVTVTGRSARGRDESVIVWCDSAAPYTVPPQDGPEEDEPPVDGPTMEEWEGPQRESLAASPAAIAQLAPAQCYKVAEEASAYGPAENGKPRNNGHVPNAGTDGHINAGNGRRKLLINLTETDQPEEDTYLLRSVLQTLLDYPGNDEVDLVIASQGKHWRLEMPIIRTSYCEELAGRISELLGTNDALAVTAVAKAAV